MSGAAGLREIGETLTVGGFMADTEKALRPRGRCGNGGSGAPGPGMSVTLEMPGVGFVEG